LSVGKFKLFWFFVWALRVGKNQMCLNVRLAFYNEAQRAGLCAGVELDIRPPTAAAD